MKPLHKIFIGLFFGLQIAGVLIARFTDAKYFCWAPYDQITRYSIAVEINNSELNINEIDDRYHKSGSGFENRNINNLIQIIRQYEETYGKNDNAKVILNYQTNGSKSNVWVWPEDAKNNK